MLVTSEDTKRAKTLIEDTIKDTENESDIAYATGLIEMAYELRVITLKEQTAYKVMLSRI